MFLIDDLLSQLEKFNIGKLTKNKRPAKYLAGRLFLLKELKVIPRHWLRQGLQYPQHLVLMLRLS